MKLKYFMLAALSVIAGSAHAQNAYDVANIPAELMKGSTAVVRNEQLNIVVRNESSATMNYTTAITILSRNSEGLAAMSEYYDKFSSVYNLKATMYDAKGQKLKTYKSSDFKDRSLTSEGTLFDDNRMKELSFYNSNYPFTIEYSYEKDFKGYLTFPSWTPMPFYDLAVEKSSYSLTAPEALKVKFLTSFNLKTDSLKTKGQVTYSWALKNMPSLEYEPMSVGLREITPWVNASPNKFEYDNSRGSVESWKDMGSWIYGLSKDVQALPEPIKVKVRQLVASAKTDREKINLLYKYLQANTRYVSVQLGIGGFKPIAADKVAAVNYGDCKALSNYMKSMLDAVDIKSNLVMLGSDMPSLNPSYSSFGQANHMILCVPSAKDTVWLECTSQFMPTGFLGNSTAAKNVLLVTEEGGKLVRTPVYKPADNFQKRKASVLLDEAGQGQISIKTNFGACQYEDHIPMLLKDPTAQRKSIMNNLGLPDMEIISATYVQPDRDLPELEEQINLKTNQLLSRGGDKMFLTLNLLNRAERVPRKVENRRTSFAVPFGYEDTDEIVYTLPKGYKASFIPDPIVLESEFGRYTAKTTLKDNQLIYTRTQQMNSQRYPAEKYDSAVAFYKKIYLADKQKAVLEKTE
jgi:transglutaminase-like putative cysteine protease